MKSLDQFLTLASEEIEADIAHYYPSIRLEELTKRKGLTHRKLMILLDRLPMESCWKTWIRDNVPAGKPTGNDEDSDEPSFSGQRWTLENYQIQGLRNDLYRVLASREENEPFVAPYEVPEGKRAEVVDLEKNDGRKVISLDEQRKLLAEVRANRGARPGNWARKSWSPDKE